LYFGQTLMDNHKPVKIFFFNFLKHDRNVIFLGNNMHEKPLEFGRMHENKTSFFLMRKLI
jgi:Zn-dependent peptidase ImmA (M78 family)